MNGKYCSLPSRKDTVLSVQNMFEDGVQCQLTDAFLSYEQGELCSETYLQSFRHSEETKSTDILESVVLVAY